MADAIEQAARQVYSTLSNHDLTVHKVVAAQTIPELGWRYKAKCGRYFYADEGAILTTRNFNCTQCQGTAPPPPLSVARREPQDAGVLAGAAP